MAPAKPYGPGKRTHLDPELYKSANRVYFFTVCAYRGQSAFVTDLLNQCVLSVLQAQSEAAGFSVFTYCLMPDHLHFLVSPKQDGASVLTFVDRYKGKSTNESWKAGWQGKLWEPRSWDHIVRREEDLFEIARYILSNPVRKGIVKSAETWRWSGQMNPLPSCH